MDTYKRKFHKGLYQSEEVTCKHGHVGDAAVTVRAAA